MKLKDLEEHEFVTVAEAARVLRVSTMTVHRLIDRGALEVVRVAGGDLRQIHRIPTQSLRDYVGR